MQAQTVAGDVGATSSAGFCLGLLGGPGAAGPPSKVQCKRDIMYMQRLFGFLCFFAFVFLLQLLNLYAWMEFLTCHTYIHRWALLPCRVRVGCVMQHSECCAQPCFSRVVFFSVTSLRETKWFSWSKALSVSVCFCVAVLCQV